MDQYDVNLENLRSLSNPPRFLYYGSLPSLTEFFCFTKLLFSFYQHVNKHILLLDAIRSREKRSKQCLFKIWPWKYTQGGK